MRIRECLHSIYNDLNGGEKVPLSLIVTSYLFNQSFRLLLGYRVGILLSESRFKIVRIAGHLVKAKQIVNRNCDISFSATIGKGVKFPHPVGIVIGSGVIVRNNVKIWQNVTLGSHGKEGEKLSYPLVEENVKIYAGAKVLGGITVGENSVIGANSVVFKDVPPNSVAVGIPAQIIKKKRA